MPLLPLRSAASLTRLQIRAVKMASALDVGGWLRDNPAPSCSSLQVTQPAIVSHWSKAEGQCRIGDATGLARYAPPPPASLPASLEGPDAPRYTPKSADEACGVETVVCAAASGGADLAREGLILTFRNNLNKVFGTPFDPGAAWAVDACRLGPALFLDIVKTEQAWAGDPADAERFTRWGYQFEALATGQAEANANEEFGVVVSSRVGPHRLLMGAEIDCVMDEPQEPPPAQQQQQPQQLATGSAPGARLAWPVAGAPLPPLSSFVELKTYRLPKHPRQQQSQYRFKHPKWWLQSFLAGVTTLGLGGRDDEGRIHRIDLARTADLPRISAQAGAAFYPNQALQFGVAALQWMREVASQQPGQHLRFSYDGTSRRLSWQLVPGGDLPARLRRCLAECGQPAAEAAAAAAPPLGEGVGDG